MNPILIVGIASITSSLLSYGVGVGSELRRRLVTRGVLLWLTIGVALDLLATVCMISVAKGTIFTPHCFLGFGATAAMIIATGLAWRQRQGTAQAPVPGWLIGYTAVAYAAWVTAFVSGILMAASRGHGGA
jgi:hypothetical protein